nr:Gfo/Idh/MocA family oxidoreductase [Rarobacter faecitabidus]
MGSMSQGVRFAVIGYGGSGRGIHARLIREAGSRVTAVVVRSPERRAQALADWPDAQVYSSIENLISSGGGFDAVVVASPSGNHVDHATQLINARIPFVIDKPLAPTADESALVLAHAREKRVPFTVFQNRRWDPEQLTLKSLIDAGDLGDVHTFERHWERWRPVPQQRWKELDPVAGGLLLDLGTHLVDSATQLFGRVQSVYADLRCLTTPVEDDVFLTLHHAPQGDKPGVISRLWGGALVGAPGPRTRVLGSKGAYLVTSFEGEASPFTVLDEAATADTEGWLVTGDERRLVTRAPGGHVDFYHAVVAWLTARGPIPVHPADAVRTAEVLDAARISSREGRCVSVRAD